MFYKLIERKRNAWFKSIAETHSAKTLLKYIQNTNALRDAQVEAIKTYLYLKLECGAQPLWILFNSGKFNSLDAQQASRFSESRDYLETHPGSLALLEYAGLTAPNGKETAPALKKLLEEAPQTIDAATVWKKIFYGVTYTDYLFSLPMGAGKTFLMAAFIYIDLYFAQQNPNDKRFAHNFMVFAPSGLKSSIVPSLRKIEEFDPAWVIPEPTAGMLKKMVTFDVLDEQKSANKSNRVKNPNAHKVNSFLTTNMNGDMGYVAVTNAEKVILDRYVAEIDDLGLTTPSDERVRLANELRSLIGRLPNLSIFIDEVHHAADGEIKLRKVVTQWAQTAENTFVQTIGFSGTPYLEKPEEIVLNDTLKIKINDLSNIVNHYPLIKGLGNFLKIPRVQISSSTQPESIITDGVKDFLKTYSKTVYTGGVCAKLAIYCGQIETLEERVAPLVSKLLAQSGFDPAVALLKFHRGNKVYPAPEGAESAFALLDSPLSKVCIVLLAQIGKEGWDCRSLTGVILPHQGVCPNNMVLQTSCRCLRQTERGKKETALIWLNQFNADKLNRQLQQLQNTNLKEFGSAKPVDRPSVARYNRMTVADVPPIDYYQLRIVYETACEETVPVASRLCAGNVLVQRNRNIVRQQDFTGKMLGLTATQDDNQEEALSFFGWLNRICKESMGNLSVKELLAEETALKSIYSQISFTKNGDSRLRCDIDQEAVRTNVRRAFYPRRTFATKVDWELCRAELVDAARWHPVFNPESLDNVVPDEVAVEQIREWDENRQKVAIKPEMETMIEQSLQSSVIDAQQAEAMRSQWLASARQNLEDPHPERDWTYHYAPYHFDSGLEKSWFLTVSNLLKEIPGVKIYFNGDDTVTGFKIRCFKRENNRWLNIGVYVPDFVLLKKKTDGCIDRLLIVETKGAHLKENFEDRRTFMEKIFSPENNKHFCDRRFGFLYLEDSHSKDELDMQTVDSVIAFFTED